MKIRRTSVFKRNFKALLKKNYDMTKFDKVLDLLLAQDKETLKQRYRDHALKGNMKGLRELHIESDWQLVYRIENENLTANISMRIGIYLQQVFIFEN